MLLCATLLLNGIGSAMASVHVQLEALASDVMTAPAAEGHDCGHPVAALADTPHAAPEPERAPGVTDCMKLCMDLSLQPVQVLSALPALPPATRTVAAPVKRVAPGLASTPRPPPLRPPIGA
nr:CopL family metal-binding regulatory protein [Luteimonas sp. MHLX1A]